MNRAIELMLSLICLAAMWSCGINEVPDNKVRYEYLTKCLWTADDHSDFMAETPEKFFDRSKPFYFTTDGKMIVLDEREGVYRYVDHYTYMIDRGTDKMTLSKGDEWHYFLIDRICETHMTLFYKGAESEYISWRRSEIQTESFDKSSFPEGWFD